MRQTVIIGNWKMQKSPRVAVEFARSLKQALVKIPNGVSVGVAPTALALREVQKELADSAIRVGGQSAHWEDSGAFTGQVSLAMLKESDFDFCLVGHSEQRQFFGETDETVNKRTKAALRIGLQPVVCVGETLAERESGTTESVIERQLNRGLQDVQLKSPDQLILAYEPVWAIGTGKTATPAMAEEVHAFCRSVLAKLLGKSLADGISIQYGGSVKADNAKVLLDQNNIDGLLVGGASLEVASFLAIINCGGK